MRARRATADERRDAVVAAAMTAFAAKGLYGSATEEIARRAGISQPYLFRLFGSKMNLFIAVLERALLEADDHDGPELAQAERVLLHALAARDEPRVRAQLIAARAGGRADEAAGGAPCAGVRSIVLRHATGAPRGGGAPSRPGPKETAAVSRGIDASRIDSPRTSGWRRG